MGTKRFFGLLSFTFSMGLCAEPATIEWRDGQKIEKAYLVHGLVAHFHPQHEARNLFGRKLEGKTEIEQPAASIFRVPKAKYRRAFSSPPDRFQSPVFSDAPRGGNLRSLPGGVLVTFPVGTDVEKWAETNGKKLVRQIGQGTTWLVESPPGMKSLEAAREFGNDPAVEGSTPNWWIQLEARQSPPSTKEATRLRRSWNLSNP
jgi:hypothetical protein